MSSAVMTATKAAGRNNVPDLGDADETANIVGGLLYMYSAEQLGFLSIRFLGDVPQGGLYWITGEAARINELRDAEDRPGIVVAEVDQNFGVQARNVLTAAGIQGIYDGAERKGLTPPVVIAGRSPLAEGLGANFDPDVTYTIAPL